MICEREGAYTLRQIPGHLVTYVTMPDGGVVPVCGIELTKENKKIIIIAAIKVGNN